ncbi:ATP-binding protein [Pelagibius sp. Alg239-R121]|uniref:ATP-binding protein n=1 Tax=Pelagibius sp. Alg239-R121 TaxID=2993448 RepID=UPI0024A698AB|nr:ATP-binding protein [Pelagibius sp. Alg239-R121]
MTPRIQANDLKAFGRSFPARELTTELAWRDVESYETIEDQLSELREDASNLRKKGYTGSYRVLFSGPPGTGKTLSGLLMGRESGRRVVYVDLPNLISQYIGETEKNLTKLLDRASAENWLLYFDEADALFSRRTQVKDAHGHYANQEVSYLLRRMEQFEDLVIFATNSCPDRNQALGSYFHRIIRFSGCPN